MLFFDTKYKYNWLIMDDRGHFFLEKNAKKMFCSFTAVCIQSFA